MNKVLNSTLTSWTLWSLMSWIKNKFSVSIIWILLLNIPTKSNWSERQRIRLQPKTAIIDVISITREATEKIVKVDCDLIELSDETATWAIIWWIVWYAVSNEPLVVVSWIVLWSAIANLTICQKKLKVSSNIFRLCWLHDWKSVCTTSSYRMPQFRYNYINSSEIR